MTSPKELIGRARDAVAKWDSEHLDSDVRSTPARVQSGILNGMNIVMHGGGAALVAWGTGDAAAVAGVAMGGVGLVKVLVGVVVAARANMLAHDRAGMKLTASGVTNIIGGMLATGAEQVLPGVGSAVNGAIAAMDGVGLANEALPRPPAQETTK